MAQNFSKVADKVIEFIQVKIEQVKLSLISSSSGIIAGLLSFGLILTILAFLLIFLSLGIAALLNDWLSSNYLGYFIVCGFYLILIIIIGLLLKNGKLQRAIEEAFIHQINDEDDE